MSLKRCPHCKAGTPKVIDSRDAGNGEVCRRRYSCSCGARFTTMEVQMGEILRPGDKGKLPYTHSPRLLGDLAAKRIIGDAYEEIK